MKPFSAKAQLLLALLPSFQALAADAPIDHSEFNPSANPKSQTLFSELDSESTGLAVENPYDDPQMWGSRYREFMGGGMGSGVAAGDFDNDGRVDLYVSAKTRPGRLFKNLGNWRFEDVTEAAGLTEDASMLGWLKSALSSSEEFVWRQGAVFADVDNDGYLDLYVCRNDAANLLYVNQGDGTFKEDAESRGLGIADGSVVGAFADYDRDGWLDVLVLTNQVEGNEPNGRPDRLFRNKGKGYFEETSELAGIGGSTFGHSATWFDYDGDGWPDLYLANDFSGPDYLYRNNRDGTFTNVINAVAPHTPYSSMGADVGDVDNNGQMDLLVADMATTTREKDRRGLAASRGDVLTTGTTQGVAPQYTRNALLLNSGLGTFGEAACWAGLEATDWTWSVRFEDFDNDGWEDLHVTNGMVREANNSDLLARMMKALSDMQRIGVIKRSPTLNESNLAYRNQGGAGFAEVTEAWGLADVGVSFGACTADFDRDGDLDIAYLNYNGALKVFRNDATGHNRIQVRLNGSVSNRFGVDALVRVESPTIGEQTRLITVARGYASGSELVAHFGLGSDETIERLTVEWPSGIVQRFTHLDVNRSYAITETEQKQSPPGPAVQPRFADRSKELGLSYADASELAIPDNEQAFLPFRTDRGGPALAVGDIDGDGADDVFMGATTGSPARILLHDSGGFRSHPTEWMDASAIEHGPSLLLDADGDGANDLLVTHASAATGAWPDAFQPKLYLNDGQGRFVLKKRLPNLSINAGAAAAADIDSDGDLDVFIGGRSVPGKYPETPESALLLNESGHFTNVGSASEELARVGLVKSALFRDLNQDGRPDLIVSTEWGQIRYFENRGTGQFVDRTEATGFGSGGRGWWNGLASADFNGDGRLDIAAGNVGLNTTYRATEKRPATLFYGDFAQNGTRLLAEAVYDGDTLYPLRSRVDIGKRLPFVLRTYPLNDDYAKATFLEVYGENATRSALKLTADNLHSGLFLSQPDGKYQFTPLPPSAQIGPIIGLAAADFDGDGLQDLFATQNTDVAIPRFHGGVGLLLKGNGKGSFETLTPEASGFALLGNGRAAVTLDPDADGRPDVFLTRHGGATAYLSNTQTEARFRTLELKAPNGRTTAWGARAEIKRASGETSFHEVGLGGGWFSQASGDLFIADPPADPLANATVWWPNGEIQRYQPPQGQGKWTLRQPDDKQPAHPKSNL